MTAGAVRSHRLVLAALATLAVSVAACAGATAEQVIGDANPPGLFPGQVVSDQGRAAADLYVPIFVIATIVFFLVEGLLLFITLRFRGRHRPGELPVQTHGSNKLEIAWTLIPALVVTGMFVATFLTLNRTEARSPDPDVTVDVQAFQWQWTFAYEEHGLSFTGAGRQGPQMVIPVDETVRIRLQATDVNHSFYVPQFFYKRDVIPGRVNEFDVKVLEPGTYSGQCAEFCGLSHAEMYFTVRAVPRPEYDAWVAAEIEKARQTPEPAPSGAASVEISASNETSFDQATVSAPPDVPVTIVFVNQDDLPHNVAIEGTPGGLFSGQPIAEGGQTVNYNAPPLPAGTYKFFCVVHPVMVGELNVGG